MKLAIIPARGGSKRIPKKNIRAFCGKAIIEYSISTAIRSGLFDRVVVSTDCEAIAQVASFAGAEVPFFRSSELSDDHTGVLPVIADTLRKLKINELHKSEFCCLYATAPFVRMSDLRAGLLYLQENSAADYALAVTTFAFPFQRAVIQSEFLTPAFSQYIQQRSQDLQEGLHDAGQFFWGRSEALLKNKTLYQNNTLPVVLPRFLVQDIDTLEDWKRAELMYKVLQETGELGE
ncbi:MAG: pseudaminic acid cytidylyltransferase [Alteromonadaceae bacterium]|nr:pseudaminic acid cytidylyltransferase [Alteromonadaceae bacterium]